MKDYGKQLAACKEYVRSKTDFVPQIALVLGSGLGAFADRIDVRCTINYADIPDFPVSTVAGHAGRFVFGSCDGVPVAVMQGRVHMYEGYEPQEAVLPIRLLRELGAKVLFLTNAAGGIQAGMKAGEFMLITDQISSFVPSPLRGANLDDLGVRFPDMSEIYSKRLQAIIRKIAVNEDIPLKEGVYVQTAGPAYESPAEIRMFRQLGADAVGMSTAIEAIAARHCGMEICGVSCISNLAAGISPHPLTHEEVKEAGDKAAPQFEKLVRMSISEIGKNVVADFSNKITIRRFEQKDADAVSALIQYTFRISNSKDYSEEYGDALAQSLSPEGVLQRADFAHAYVAADEGRIIGCGMIAPFFGSETESILLTVFVLPEYQGYGIGRQIVETLEQDEFYLRARRVEIPSSVTAVDFYRKLGYDYKDGVAELDAERHYRLEKFR
ncbi:MAG TPA: hypothetical protein DDX71_02000 [Ruminococcus sp.]|nr:hypothetical protein [Ruminococcus sp.]